MRPSIGFVLVTHNHPEQALFLCQRLSKMYDSPPIVIHNDFSQCLMNTELFPANVSFVQDWLKTRWGSFDVIDAELRAVRDLYRDSDPDWFVVLSGADYPIQPAETVLENLYTGGYDAYLDNRKIEDCRLSVPPEGFGDQNFVDPRWVRIAFERYMAIGFGFYKLATKMGWKKKAFYLRSNAIIKRFTPFDGTLDCYAGDHWLSGNRRAANALLADNETNRKLRTHFKSRPNSDEGLLQTILKNNPDLEVSADNKRYADWRGCTNHPRSLTVTDFPTLLVSEDHFARKFVFDPSALRELDVLVDAKVEIKVGR